MMAVQEHSTSGNFQGVARADASVPDRLNDSADVATEIARSDSRAETKKVVEFHAFERAYSRYEQGFVRRMRSLSKGNAPLFSRTLTLFEDTLADSVQVPHAVSVSSGTAAITTALHALQLPPSSHVLCPTYTFVGTVNAIREAGHHPVFVDCGFDQPNVTPDEIERAYAAAPNRPPAALISVDMFGTPVDYACIADVVRKLGLRWICDNAQSFGANVEGRSVMQHGDLATTSFYPGKVLGGITDGGCVFTSDATLAHRVRLLRNQGFSGSQHHDLAGAGNARFSTVAAMFLLERLEGFSKEMERRLEIARSYDAVLRSRGVTVAERHRGWNGYMYYFQTVDIGSSLENFRKYRVDCRRYYEHLAHQLVNSKDNDSSIALPNAKRLSGRLLSLPLHPFLGPDEIERVCNALSADPGLVP